MMMMLLSRVHVLVLVAVDSSYDYDDGDEGILLVVEYYSQWMLQTRKLKVKNDHPQLFLLDDCYYN